MPQCVYVEIKFDIELARNLSVYLSKLAVGHVSVLGCPTAKPVSDLISNAAGMVRVRRQWQRGAFAELKTAHSQRTVPLTSGLVADLKRWRLACPNGDLDLVFPSPRGRPLSASNFLKRVFYSAFERAGFERAELTSARFRFHQLRQTFATQALAAGISVSEVSRYLGHSSIGVTLSVYAHVLPGGHDAARAKLADLYDGIAGRGESETEVKLAASAVGGRRRDGA